MYMPVQKDDFVPYRAGKKKTVLLHSGHGAFLWIKINVAYTSLKVMATEMQYKHNKYGLESQGNLFLCPVQFCPEQAMTKKYMAASDPGFMT